MVGIGALGADHLLARVSLVNFYGHPILDELVKPPPGTRVMDWRTAITGIRPGDLDSGKEVIHRWEIVEG